MPRVNNFYRKEKFICIIIILRYSNIFIYVFKLNCKVNKKISIKSDTENFNSFDFIAFCNSFDLYIICVLFFLRKKIYIYNNSNLIKTLIFSILLYFQLFDLCIFLEKIKYRINLISYFITLLQHSFFKNIFI